MRRTTETLSKFECKKIALSITIEDHASWSECGGTRSVTNIRGSTEGGGEAEADQNRLAEVLGVQYQELMRAGIPWALAVGEQSFIAMWPTIRVLWRDMGASSREVRSETGELRWGLISNLTDRFLDGVDANIAAIEGPGREVRVWGALGLGIQGLGCCRVRYLGSSVC